MIEDILIFIKLSVITYHTRHQSTKCIVNMLNEIDTINIFWLLKVEKKYFINNIFNALIHVF